MRQMKDSGIDWIGDIPEHWDVKTVSNVAYEHCLKNELEHNQNLLSLSYGNIIRKDINTNGGLLPASFDTYQIVEDGNVVLRLTDLQNDQRSLRVGHVNERGIITSAYVAIAPKSNIHSHYLYYCLHTADLCKVFYSLGGGVRQGAKWEDVASIKIVLPPFAEQVRITETLDRKCGEVDELIKLQEQMISRLEDYRKSVISETVTRGLNPDAPLRHSGIHWLGNIPVHWNIVPLKYSTTYNDESWSETTNEKMEVSYVEIGDVDNSKGIINKTVYQFKDAPSRARRITRKGDVIISTVRTYLRAIAKINEDGLTVSTGFIVLRAKEINSDYLSYAVQEESFINSIIASSVGISYPAINASDIIKLSIPIPPSSEQQAIADYLDRKCGEIDALIAVKRKKIEKLKEYKKSIIFEYVTGKKAI